MRLMGLENNKAAHRIPVCEQAPATRITRIGWASSSIASAPPRPVASRLADGLDDASALPADLPQELTFLEVDTALPKISPLPSASAGAE